MLGMLIAYDALGNVLHSRDYQVVYDPDTLEPLGLIDFLAAESAGIENTEFWRIETFDIDRETGAEILRDPQPVKGSKVWPEYLGGAAHHFRVILAGPAGNKRIVKLVHKGSGHVRDREQIEAAIESRKDEARREGRAADLRDLVGGPDRPLRLDDEGKTRPRTPRGSRPLLPFVSGRGRSQPPGQE
jgi:hypothetical protein